jgi:hypothetical protein
MGDKEIQTPDDLGKALSATGNTQQQDSLAQAEDSDAKRAGKSGVVASMDFYKNFDAKRNSLAKIKYLVMAVLFVFFLCIVSFEYYCLSWSLEEDSPNNSQFKISILGKFTVFIFMVSVFAWMARIFNQIRRLEITYGDKAIIAKTYESFLKGAEDNETMLMKKAALKTLFEPTLVQAERSRSIQRDEYLGLGGCIEKLCSLLEKSK